jgi:hypothetical protein
METKTIVIAGVGLGALLLIIGGGKSKPAQTDYVQTVYGASAQRDAMAPALIASAGDIQVRNTQAMTDREQIQLAAANTHDAQILDFMATMSGQQVRREGQTLAFAGSNLQGYREADVQKKQIASTEKIALKQITTQADLAKKQMDQGFLNGIIGGITGGLNPAQSFYGGAGASGLQGTGTQASMQASSNGTSLLNSVIGAVASIYGGSSGGALSSLGGGVGGGGGGGGGILSSILGGGK